MGEMSDPLGSYRVEVSGWGFDDSFFVEKTDLVWTRGGEKKLLLRQALPSGAIVFVRLTASVVSCDSVPVAYRVESVQPMNCAGQCELRLLQLHPRSKESCLDGIASELVEHSVSKCETNESSK